MSRPSLISYLGRRPGIMEFGRRLHRLANPINAALLRSRLHRVLSSSLALLTVTGRRTGTPYVLPVQYARSGSVVVVVPGGHESKTWWRNLQTPAPVRIRIAGRDLAGTGEALAGTDHRQEVADALEVYLKRFPKSAALRGVSQDNGRFDRSRLLAAADQEIIVRIVLTDA